MNKNDKITLFLMVSCWTVKTTSGYVSMKVSQMYLILIDVLVAQNYVIKPEVFRSCNGSRTYWPFLKMRTCLARPVFTRTQVRSSSSWNWETTIVSIIPIAAKCVSGRLLNAKNALRTETRFWLGLIELHKQLYTLMILWARSIKVQKRQLLCLAAVCHLPSLEPNG